MIWILGGSHSTYGLTQFLKGQKKAYHLTTITAYNRDLPLSYTSEALSKPLSLEEVQGFIKQNQITLVIDCTYEQDVHIRKVNLAACETCKISYIRYEATIEKLYLLEEAIEAAKACEPFIVAAINRKQLEIVAGACDLNKFLIKGSPRLMKTCERLKVTQIVNELEAIHQPIHLMITEQDEQIKSKKAFCEKRGIKLMVLNKDQISYPYYAHSLEALEVLIKALT